MTENLKGMEVTKARLDDWKESKLQSVIKKCLWSREGNISVRKEHNRHLHKRQLTTTIAFFARGDL